MAQFLSSVPELMDAGLRGSRLPRGRALALRLAAIVAFLVLWSLLSGAVVVLKLFNPIFLPGPWLVLGSVLDMAVRGPLWIHLAATLERVAMGFGAGAALGVALGLAAGHLTPVRNVVEPLVEVLRPIPPLALLPMFIVWVGIGEASKIGFITYATFFPIFLTTVTGVRQIDPLLVRAAESLGARGVALFTRVILPAALPDILTGLRLGVALAFFVIVISEFIGAEHGLGYLINDGRNFFLVPQMLGAAVVLGLLGYAGNGLVRLLERRLTRWQHPA
ncbi:MAG: ABC transporter permease [Candidatus Rokuibacteriota bacterium]|nr:MAG: ABC transporter permease [Candidatus Rokubacteria bacterium]